MSIREFRNRPRLQQRKRHFWNELAFFKPYRVYSNSLKMQISLELISWGPHSSLERERKFHRRLFTFSTKRKIRHFHVVVVLQQQRNVEKSVMHVQTCCFDVSLFAVDVVVAKTPHCLPCKCKMLWSSAEFFQVIISELKLQARQWRLRKRHFKRD